MLENQRSSGIFWGYRFTVQACSLLNVRFQQMHLFLRSIFRSSHRSCSMKKIVLKNFAKFTGKYLRQSFFINKVAELRCKLHTFICNFLCLTLFTSFCSQFLASCWKHFIKTMFFRFLKILILTCRNFSTIVSESNFEKHLFPNCLNSKCDFILVYKNS